ncbi:MAG: hypothetical protein WD876_00270 [Candidatus Pacearchaeota archaeon]
MMRRTKRRLRRVVKIDVARLRTEESLMFVVNWTILWEISKIVCLHVKAIVNPAPTTTSVFNCLRKSFLKFLA